MSAVWTFRDLGVRGAGIASFLPPAPVPSHGAGPDDTRRWICSGTDVCWGTRWFPSPGPPKPLASLFPGRAAGRLETHCSVPREATYGSRGICTGSALSTVLMACVPTRYCSRHLALRAPSSAYPPNLPARTVRTSWNSSSDSLCAARSWTEPVPSFLGLELESCNSKVCGRTGSCCLCPGA